MIITGIFLFLLGTKFGQAAINAEVKYDGPNKIIVNEHTEESFILPGLGSPPFAPNFIHQGSNFFFNPQIVMSSGIMTSGMKNIIAPPMPVNEVAILNPEVKTKKIIEEVVVVPELPKIEINPAPCVDIEIKNIMPDVPILIEEPIRPASVFIPEIDVRISEIPPPPVLPPLILTEFPKPVLVQENKRVVLVPAAPDLTMFYPPPMLVAEHPLLPVDCAQNIVFERVLPNLAFEYGKTIELISIPASKRAPVVSSIVY